MVWKRSRKTENILRKSGDLKKNVIYINMHNVIIIHTEIVLIDDPVLSLSYYFQVIIIIINWHLRVKIK